eukprot:m.243658 g.243658  ORF g.243658 m.243658 type:complete len:354 (-) comp19458_c0_seq1:150-1211(-)
MASTMADEVEASKPYAWLRPTVSFPNGCSSSNTAELGAHCDTVDCASTASIREQQEELDAMFKRRQELRHMDLESNEAAQLEWASLMLQLDRRLRESYQTNADLPAVDAAKKISQSRVHLRPTETVTASLPPPILLDTDLDNSRTISDEESDLLRSGGTSPVLSRTPQAKPKAFDICFDDEGTVVDVDEITPTKKSKRNSKSAALGTPSSRFRWFHRESREYVSPKKSMNATNNTTTSVDVVLAPEMRENGDSQTTQEADVQYSGDNSADEITSTQISFGALYVDEVEDTELCEPAIRDGISRMRDKLQQLVACGKFSAKELMLGATGMISMICLGECQAAQIMEDAVAAAVE